MKRLLFLFLPLALLMAGCPTGDDDDATPEPTPCDNDGPPELAVAPVEDGQPVGFPVDVGAQVTDGDGVSTVTLWYRPAGSPAPWQNIFLSQVEAQPEFWVGQIPGTGVVDPGVDWYVVAKDTNTGCPDESVEPIGAPEQFFTFTTQLDLSPIPYNTDFELDGEDCGTEDVSQLGWVAAVEGFPQETHGWRLRPQSPLSGRCSASHSEGIPFLWECPPPEGEGTILRKNWLISPPLDLRGKDNVATRWFEKRLDSGSCAEVHRLYVSTGSPDPATGDYELLAELDLPDTDWGSSEWFDLSAYAGADRAFVALYYEGGAASRWQVDDFYVGEPLADLRLDEVAFDDGLAPGSSGVALSVSLVNASDEYGAANLTGTLLTTDEHLTITNAEATWASLAPGATEPASNPFAFDVAATHADNAYLDFVLLVEDEADHSWTVPIRILMGQESSVRVDWTAAGASELGLELGYGFAAAPEWTAATTSVAQTSGFWQFTITEQAAALPPGPGLRRWFLRAINTGGEPASIDAVTFTVGGETIDASQLADGPLDVPIDGEVILQIPVPPALELASMAPVPDPPGPGDSVSLESVALTNTGSATAGPVSCAMGTSDPNVSSVNGDPVTFGTTVIDTDDVRDADGDFSFTIDAGHVNNAPVELTLLCIDGVETLPVSFEVDVPYARPTLVGFEIDDSSCAGCNNNGYLDAEEQVDVRVIARNDGAFDTAGPLEVTLSVGTGSTADFTMPSSSTVSFGSDPLAVGEERTSDDTFTVSLAAGALMGDSIVLDLAFESDGDTWTDEGLLEAVGLDWLPCPGDLDPQGDTEAEGAIDIKGCSYRSDTDLLQVRMEAYNDFDPATAFVDFFLYETPELYVVESVGGNPDLETGCVFGDDVPDDEITTPLDITFTSNTATLRLALDDLGVLGNNVQVAFGAGSCPGTYFCDVYPGLPALFFDLFNSQASCDGPEMIQINWLPVF